MYMYTFILLLCIFIGICLYVGNGSFYEIEIGKEDTFSILKLIIYNEVDESFTIYLDICIFGWYLSIHNSKIIGEMKIK